MKKPGLWDGGMVTGVPGENLIEKNWPGLSGSDMVTGGLKLFKKIYKTTCKIPHF